MLNSPYVINSIWLEFVLYIQACCDILLQCSSESIRESDCYLTTLITHQRTAHAPQTFPDPDPPPF